MNCFLSHVYISPEHGASFTGLDELYRTVKNQFPSLTREEIRKWAESNLSYSLHKPSRRTFIRNKVYAPEIECLYSRNKTNDLMLNLTPENVTQHSRIVTTTRKGSSTPTKMSKIIGRQIH